MQKRSNLRQLLPGVGLWATREAERTHRKEQVFARKAPRPETRCLLERWRVRAVRARRQRLGRGARACAGRACAARAPAPPRLHPERAARQPRGRRAGRVQACSLGALLTLAVEQGQCLAQPVRGAGRTRAVSQRVSRVGATGAAPGETRPRLGRLPQAACRCGEWGWDHARLDDRGCVGGCRAQELIRGVSPPGPCREEEGGWYACGSLSRDPRSEV